MNIFKNFSSLLVCIMFSLFASPVWCTSKYFEWIDDNGTKHLEETCPADCLKKPHLQKDNKGRIIKTDSTLPPEDHRAQEEVKSPRNKDENALKERKPNDQALINSFNHQKEPDQPRNRNLQQFASH